MNWLLMFWKQPEIFRKVEFKSWETLLVISSCECYFLFFFWIFVSMGLWKFIGHFFLNYTIVLILNVFKYLCIAYFRVYISILYICCAKNWNGSWIPIFICETMFSVFLDHLWNGGKKGISKYLFVNVFLFLPIFCSYLFRRWKQE